MAFLATVAFFPTALIELLFDEKYSSYTKTFLILGIAGFLSSFTTSSGTSLLLQKKDYEYSRNLIIAALATIISGILFYYLINDEPYLIALAVLFGEITISLLNITSLKQERYIISRAKQAASIISMSLVFGLGYNIFSNSFIGMLFSVFLFGMLVFIYTIKKID